MTSTKEKPFRTKLEQIKFTPEEAMAWELPSVQRELSVNQKVRAMAEKIRANNGVISGVLTFCKLDGRNYLLDGQHRVKAFLLSEQAVGQADIRTCYFENAAQMGVEFNRLNSPLARMRPDDHLRAIESDTASLREIRKECPWIGYDKVRRNSTKAPFVSMSSMLKNWASAANEVPLAPWANAETVAREIQSDDLHDMLMFLQTAMAAWDRDPQYSRLWQGLNITLCMWLFRRIVVETPVKSTKLTHKQFKVALESLSASSSYIGWLTGRNMNEIHRTPAYKKIKRLIGARMLGEFPKQMTFPSPPWTVRARP